MKRLILTICFCLLASVCSGQIIPKPDNKYELNIMGEKVDIGGNIQGEFKPTIKLNRWGGECSLNVKLPTIEKIVPINEDNKVKWAGEKKDVHIYSDGDSVEFEIILKEKPLSNKITLEIETSGLRFSYQPPLTEEVKPPWVETVTETQGFDKDNVLVWSRPEKVVGSYAVFHDSKQGDYTQLNGKNYKAGKAFHIYRPKMKDSKNKEVWGELFIDEQAGEMVITIPQKFIDTAKYPIYHAAGAEFGYTDVGETENGYNDDVLTSFGPYSPVENGTATDIVFYGYAQLEDSIDITFGFYDDTGSDYPQDRQRDTDNLNFTDNTPSERTNELDSSKGVSSATLYWISRNHDGDNFRYFYDDDAGYDYLYQNVANVQGTLPDPHPGGSDRLEDWRHTCWVVYTPTAEARRIWAIYQ